MARQVLPAPAGQVMIPDVPNWAWHEYGMRVGFWRFHELYGRLGIRPTLSDQRARVPRLSTRRRSVPRRRMGIMGHSYEQGPIHNEKDQPAMIAPVARHASKRLLANGRWDGSAQV